MIPTVEYFNAMWQYVIWADRLQLAAADTLSDEEYFKPRGFSFGNIHGVLLHQVAANQAWLDRFEHRPPSWLADEPRMQARSAIAPQRERTHAEFTRFLALQNDVTLHENLTIKSRVGFQTTQQVGKLLIHVINHAMHHRGQLNSMLQLAGATPPKVDYTAYLSETS